jgi:uncharacterized metal-binding protein YceD (DUF177 family)
VKAALPEFSRRVALARLGRDPFRQQIAASREECEKLARRFGLLALDRLAAAVTLSRRSGASILLEASFEAEFVQECVVSLEPVRGALRRQFSLLYGPATAEREVALDGAEVSFEPLTGEAIDIAEAVAQELSLALPEFPRDPQAALETGATEAAAEQPFASLARWRGAGER